MADEADITPIDNVEPEETPGYVPPKEKTIDELTKLDQDDESLVKYKQTLLGGNVDPASAPSDDPRRIIVQKMSFVSPGHPDIELDLTGDLSKLKMVVKEGVEYKIMITFLVHHEIVAGLRYHHAITRKGINADKQTYMVGSYGPKVEPQTWTSPLDEAPKGMLYRGRYVVKSKFIDDDKSVHLQWEWEMDIKKDWA